MTEAIAMTVQPNVRIESHLNEADMLGLCRAVEAGIHAGGGFGWVDVPTIEAQLKHWNGILKSPHIDLIIARLDQRIVGAVQLVKPVPKNEAGHFIGNISTLFVDPIARGRGVGKALVQHLEKTAYQAGLEVLCLDVRETLKPAIALYESQGFERWGTKPKYARIDGVFLDGYYYMKELEHA